MGSNSPAAEDMTVASSTEQQQQQEQVVPDFFSPQSLAASVGATAVPLTAAMVDLSTPAAAAARVNHAGSIYDADAVNPKYNKSGLNGLTVGSTTGLTTGNFTVSAQMPVLYTVQEVPGILDIKNKALLRGVVPGSFPFVLGPEPEVAVGLRRLVVIDNNVERIYGDRLRQYFEHHGVEYKLLVLPTCEENKELHLVTTIAEAIEEFKINRRQEPIIAIGGGVCLDVAGLAANLFRRNTGIIKVPTTVMGVVDASIGIKTAVNFHEKKNKLGTYCPPLGVLYDTSFLRSLDSRHISNGSAEILKMACIKDRDLFELMDKYAEDLIAEKFQGPVGAAAIRRSIQGMLEELEYNLWEAILVRLVDYGHTISPELEMAALRSPEMLLHGEAVTIDMALSAELSYGRGLITAAERARILGLMVRLGLPLWHESCNLKLFMKGLEDMTRTRDGLQRVPLMKSIGAAVFIYDITEMEMGAAADRLMQYAAANGSAAAAAVLAERKTEAYLANNVVRVPSGLLSGVGKAATTTAAAEREHVH
jgi:3-dehydroquinate synthase